MEELRRERLPEQPAPTTDTSVAGHRGPCACGRSLFPDECDGSCKAFWRAPWMRHTAVPTRPRCF